jgi:BlaR1 peptidase M56
MMTELLPYSCAVALLVGLAAFGAERIVAWRGAARRGIWLAALLISLALPALRIATSPPHALPRLSGPPVALPIPAALPAGASSQSDAALPMMTPAAITPPSYRWPSRQTLERYLELSWATASTVLILVYGVLWSQLQLASRRWRRECIDDQLVWVTDALGPAVSGFIRPKIVLPQWAVDAPAQERSLILAHEREHIAAGDPWLCLVGLLAIAALPWNLPLWWQFRRLRFALEVDCDARVLHTGADARAYGEVLLAVGKRRTAAPMGAMALTEPASQLLRRLRIMINGLPRRSGWPFGALALGSLACVTVAAALQAPSLTSSHADSENSEGAVHFHVTHPDMWAQKARVAAIATYPELANGGTAKGLTEIVIALNGDGSVYKSFKREFSATESPTIVTDQKTFDSLGIDIRDFQASGLSNSESKGLARAGGPIVIAYGVLYSTIDSTRATSTVRKAVRERYADRLQPTQGDILNHVTVLMNDTGGIDRGVADLLNLGDKQPSELTLKPFTLLGASPTEIGPIGQTEIRVGQGTSANPSRVLLIDYAWPRRANELATQPVINRFMRPTATDADAQAVASLGCDQTTGASQQTVLLDNGNHGFYSWTIPTYPSIHDIVMPNGFHLGVRVKPAPEKQYSEFAAETKAKYVPELVEIAVFDMSSPEPRLITMTYGGANSEQGYGPHGGADVVKEVGEPGITLYLHKATCIPAPASNAPTATRE